MTRKHEQAADLFREGFSCSQAVFAAFAPGMGVDREKALKLSQAFGGGMAQMGKTCGAVTGALLVIGLKYGRTQADDREAKDNTYALTKKFLRHFHEEFGYTGCRELIQIDLDNPEDVEKAEKAGLFESKCSEYVTSAAIWLEKNL